MEKTFSKQHELPSLPVPKLEDSFAKYLRSVKALASKTEYTRTEQQIREFLSSPLSKKLQNLLEKRGREQRNWLEEWWYDVYNYIRSPLAPTLNLACTNSIAYPLRGSQLCRASELTHQYMQFWMKIRKQQLPIARSRGCVWDMNQYRCIFNAARVPERPKDRIVRYFQSEEEGPSPSHVIVFCRGNIWKLETLNKDNTIKTVDEIYHMLKYIQEHSESVHDSIITLTSEIRDMWADHRLSLMVHSDKNMKMLEDIESSVFCLTLADKEKVDQESLLTGAMMDDSKLIWQDKSLSVVVHKDGQLQMHSDHSNVDAIALLHCNQESVRNSRMEIWTPKKCDFKIPEILEFHYRHDFQRLIHLADIKFEHNKTTFRAQKMVYDTYGNKWLKSMKIYTDTVIQIALQLAYYKTHKSFAPIYETASTRKFYHGRTETVRGCTVEMVDFGRAAMHFNASKGDLRQLFLQSYEAHNKIMADCCNGQGFDRHLLGLQMVLEEMNQQRQEKIPLPEVFADPVWEKVGGNGNFLLSTSFIGYLKDDEDESFGFVTAMRKDGYGVFYKIGDDRLVLTVTDWINSKSLLKDFVDNIYWSLDRIAFALEAPAKM